MKEYIQTLSKSPFSKKLYQTVYRIIEAVDPAYQTERAALDLNVSNLRHLLEGESASLLEEVLRANEDRMNLNLSFLMWLGVFQNYACHLDHRYARFLEEEYEDFHLEAYMNSFMETQNAVNLSIHLSSQLSEEGKELLYNVTDYYCYLETVAYKLAHYAGFCLGNQILPRVISDYQPNTALTDRQAQRLMDYLKK